MDISSMQKKKAYCSWGTLGKNTGILFMGYSWQEYWGGLPFSPPVDCVLSELFTMTRPSWVALHSMAHNFIELCKHLHHNKAMIHEGVTKLEYVEKQRHHSVDKGLYSKG